MPPENLEISERMRVTSFIISSMLTTLITLLATLSSIFRSRAALELENLALRHQIGVLRRAAAKRLKLTSADRLLWICLSRLWRGWRSALTIVKPETVNFLQQRQDGLAVAYQLHPERFVRSAPKPPALPSEVWINKPVSSPEALPIGEGI
jgi:hypothetical protein